jgi:hypothetical protein
MFMTDCHSYAYELLYPPLSFSIRSTLPKDVEPFDFFAFMQARMSIFS